MLFVRALDGTRRLFTAYKVWLALSDIATLMFMFIMIECASCSILVLHVCKHQLCNVSM